MLVVKFPKGFGETDVKAMRAAVRAEASQSGLPPKQGYVLLFVVDELSCNVMEHGRASWAELKVQTHAAGFNLVLTDDGIPFDTAAHALSVRDLDLKDAGERRVGLNFVGRLVDQILYQRTPDGLNKVEIAKTF
jgi:anti-sigma regulatory factor (Ser/Thr protein kinase)